MPETLVKYVQAMRRTYREAPTTGRPSPYRVTLSVLSLLAAGVILVSIAVQITDRAVNDAFVPETYFSYFTIQTSLANILLLAVCGIYGLRTARDSKALSVARASIVTYAMLTAAVYNILLRDIPVAEGVWVSSLQWPNEITHVWIPLYFVLDWLLNPYRHPIGWSTLGVGLIYPAAWFGFTEVRGQLTGWYPYAFLNPSSDAGWAGVGVYAAGITATLVAVLAAIILINVIHQKTQPTRLSDR